MAQTTQSGLSEAMLKIIRGEVPPEQKEDHYDASLHRWWLEYAARKNDEEQEHVADSLLYDERCHLPRTAPRPTFSAATELSSAMTDLNVQQQQQQQQAQGNGTQTKQ